MTMLFVLLNLSTSGIQNFSVAALVAGYGVELSLANVALTSFLFASAFGVLAGDAVADRTYRHGHVAITAFLLTTSLILLVAVVRLPSAVLVLVMSTAGFLSGVIAPSREMLVRSAAQPGAEGRVFGTTCRGPVVDPRVVFGIVAGQTVVDTANLDRL